MKFTTDEVGYEYFFDPRNKKAGSIVIRLVPRQVLNDIIDKTTSKKRKWRRNQWVEEVTEDTKQQDELLWDYQIVSWDGVELPDSEVNALKKEGFKVDSSASSNGFISLECTKNNKVLMMQKSAHFANFYAECLMDLQDRLPSDLEKEKNLRKQLGTSTKEDSSDSTAKSAKK